MIIAFSDYSLYWSYFFSETSCYLRLPELLCMSGFLFREGDNCNARAMEILLDFTAF